MPLQHLTAGQQSLVDSLKLTNTDDRALKIVVAAMNYRNAMSPSGSMNRDQAANDMFDLIDKVS